MIGTEKILKRKTYSVSRSEVASCAAALALAAILACPGMAYAVAGMGMLNHSHIEDYCLKAWDVLVTTEELRSFSSESEFRAAVIDAADLTVRVRSENLPCEEWKAVSSKEAKYDFGSVGLWSQPGTYTVRYNVPNMTGNFVMDASFTVRVEGTAEPSAYPEALEFATEEDRPLPEEVLAQLPEPRWFENGELALSPKVDMYSVRDDGGTWEFAGWSPESAYADGGSVLFTGTWVYRLDAVAIAKPIPVTALTYDGAMQKGVLPGKGYTLTGTVAATNAGTYVTTATPMLGYVWEDGSTDPIDIEWYIGKAVLTALCEDQSALSSDPQPELAVTVKGFLNGEDASTALGYQAPSASLPEAWPLAAGSYAIAPSGGEATNYRFEYLPGTLTVSVPEPATYSMKFSFAPDGAATLPDEVMALLPPSLEAVPDGTLVAAPDPLRSVVAVSDGVWEFAGWDRDSIVVNGANVLFAGVWKWTANPPKEDPPPDDAAEKDDASQTEEGEQGSHTGAALDSLAPELMKDVKPLPQLWRMRDEPLDAKDPLVDSVGVDSGESDEDSQESNPAEPVRMRDGVSGSDSAATEGGRGEGGSDEEASSNEQGGFSVSEIVTTCVMTVVAASLLCSVASDVSVLRWYERKKRGRKAAA